ncbi:membrane protein containing GGDEF domain [Sulfurimonas gotlandica GD1]|uniref:diguanylate cyclase n=2 Tax=Sulfurimonas TaxID=202746 RepID=B6BML0_SULGG|nr:GGDEF domain/pas/pac sensor domain protein [Sulfurimonas gotlandica GD1]EHP30874.1 membrane protein containing GGDEF domain [Sulfurimonas gotlandica GD1]
MDKLNIVLRVVFPFVLGLLLIASVSIFGMYYLQKQHIKKQSYKVFENVSTILSQTITSDIENFVGTIELLKKDPKIIKYFKEKDRDRLFLYLYQIYSDFNEMYNITHFYFHNIDKTNFIRIHNRDKHSDYIDRITLSKAFETANYSSGIEFGIYHNLTLRVVAPIFNEDELIGFIELGKDIDYLTRRLSKSLNGEIIFTISKDMISKENFEVWTKQAAKNIYYKELDDFYVIDSSIKYIRSELQDLLNSRNDISNIEVVNGRHTFHVNSTPFRDVTGKEIGKLYVLLDTSDEFKFLISLIIEMSLIVGAIIIAMIFYYWKYVKKTEKKLNKAHEKIHSLSIKDGLTMLYNRHFFNDNVPLQINNAARNKKKITFLMIDADNFKKYNDNYGHVKGDIVLKEIANTCKELFQRSTDMCYRVGGEEFVVVFESENDEYSHSMAEKLCKSIENLDIEHKYNDGYNRVTVSIGMCTSDVQEITNFDHIYANADKALYLSKENGRNRVTKYC